MYAETWPSHTWLAEWISMRPLTRHCVPRNYALTVVEPRNLMARDEFKNLGFKDAKEDKVANDNTPKPGQSENGAKGELRW